MTLLDANNDQAHFCDERREGGSNNGGSRPRPAADRHNRRGEAIIAPTCGIFSAMAPGGAKTHGRRKTAWCKYIIKVQTMFIGMGENGIRFMYCR